MKEAVSILTSHFFKLNAGKMIKKSQKMNFHSYKPQQMHHILNKSTFTKFIQTFCVGLPDSNYGPISTIQLSYIFPKFLMKFANFDWFH